MENAIDSSIQGDCMTDEIREIVEKKLRQFRRRKAWAQIGIIMEKGVIKRIRTIQDENISDLLLPVVK